MTREEAIKALRLERGIEINGNAVRVAEFLQGLDVAISALRPVSREQVEKVWRGEWINKHSAYDHKIFTCARCGKRISIQGENLNFCPKCGSAQTDKAVDILLKRLEVLKDDKGD